MEHKIDRGTTTITLKLDHRELRVLHDFLGNMSASAALDIVKASTDIKDLTYHDTLRMLRLWDIVDEALFNRGLVGGN